tara:strand:- start:7607 stop:8641 length:1035 start_codon:yes stop_codon:yes gene_type:complete
MQNNKLQFYADSIIAETLLKDNLVKVADGSTAEFVSSIKEYFESKINPNDKTGSIINELAPGLILTMLRGTRFGWLGLLLSIAMSVFHIDVNSILSSVFNSVKNYISSGKQITPDQVDNIVSGSVNDHAGASEPDNDFILKENFSKRLRSAKLIKIAIMDYNLNKNAGIFGDSKSKVISLLITVISLVFKVALTSAGVMVVGDIINHVSGRPNSLDHTYHAESKDKAESPEVPVIRSTQTKFKIKTSYSDKKYNVGSQWIEQISNDPSSIAQMVVNFTKEVYDGLDNLDNIIRDTSGFSVVVDRIISYNKSSQGDREVYIPKYLNSKKEIADLFIDEVADKSST